MGRTPLAVLVIAVGLVLAGILAALGRPEPPVIAAEATPAPAGVDWTPWFEGDFNEKRAEIRDGRILLRCSTLGTGDRTITSLGMTAAPLLPLKRPTRVFATLDWNGPSSRSSLTAALLLSGPGGTGSPLSSRDWLKVEYGGLPPGKNGRMTVSCRRDGRERVLFQEGRPLSRYKVEIALKDGKFEVRENGVLRYACDEPLPRMSSGQVSVLTTCPGNTPPGEVFFEDVRWE